MNSLFRKTKLQIFLLLFKNYKKKQARDQNNVTTLKHVFLFIKQPIKTHPYFSV